MPATLSPLLTRVAIPTRQLGSHAIQMHFLNLFHKYFEFLTTDLARGPRAFNFRSRPCLISVPAQDSFRDLRHCHMILCHQEAALLLLLAILSSLIAPFQSPCLAEPPRKGGSSRNPLFAPTAPTHFLTFRSISEWGNAGHVSQFLWYASLQPATLLT